MGAKANFCLSSPFHTDPHDPSAKAGSPYLFSVWGRGVRGDLRARTTFGVTVATPASSSQPLASKTGKQSCQNQRLSITKRERRRSPPHESLARREQRSRAEPSRAQTAPGGPPRPSPGGGGLATSRSCFPSRLQALPPRSPTAAGEAPPPPPPSALPGAEGLLAAQAQEAAAEQQAAQRRGQGDDSPHGALGNGARRSYCRPIVFKGGCGRGRRPWQPQGLSAPPLARNPAPPPPSAPLPPRPLPGALPAGAAGAGGRRGRSEGTGFPPNFPLRRAARRSPGRFPGEGGSGSVGGCRLGSPARCRGGGAGGGGGRLGSAQWAAAAWGQDPGGLC